MVAEGGKGVKGIIATYLWPVPWWTSALALFSRTRAPPYPLIARPVPALHRGGVHVHLPGRMVCVVGFIAGFMRGVCSMAGLVGGNRRGVRGMGLPGGVSSSPFSALPVFVKTN